MHTMVARENSQSYRLTAEYDFLYLQLCNVAKTFIIIRMDLQDFSIELERRGIISTSPETARLHEAPFYLLW